jgi:lysophospholipase L1-like esterase
VSLPQGWTTITVVATDQAEWTTREQRHVVRDALPTAPALLAPSGGEFAATGRPTLTMNPATDANGDALLHTMEIYADATLTQRLAQSPPLPVGTGAVSWVVVPELVLNGGTRYWRARAFDGVLYGPWSAVATFRLPDIGIRDPHRVLGYGDSITAGAQTQNGGWIYCEGYREDLELALTAFYGDATVDTTWVPAGTSADGMAQMEERLAGRAEGYLLILFGTIDVGTEPPTNLQTVKNNISAIATYARSIGMVAVVGTVPPRLDSVADLRIQQLNALLLQLEDDDGILVADLYARLVEVAAGDLRRVVCEDGVHPSDLGYSVIAEVWYRTLTGSEEYPLMARLAAQIQASQALQR